jgi:hypothetical protein
MDGFSVKAAEKVRSKANMAKNEWQGLKPDSFC